MAGGRGAGQIIDLVHLQPDRYDDVVTNLLKVGFVKQMRDINFVAGEKIVDTDHVITTRNQHFTELGS